MDGEAFMREAIALAKKGVGRTSPNPAVGAVIVKGGKVIGKGFHRKAGLPHAEIEAIASVKGSLKGAALYVTLEPCCHFGKTPPCTEAVLASGIKKVVIGMKDPNPRVSGKGVKRLSEEGVEVISGVLEDECRALNGPFIKYMRTGVPFVTLKLASTLDGKIATASGESKWITGEASRKLVHKLRVAADAVMVGSGTVIKDDPELNVRHGVKGRNPVKVVLDSTFKIPLTAKVFKNGGRLIVFTSKDASATKIKKATSLGAEVIAVPKKNGALDINRVLKELGRREITSVLVEGGGRLAASLIREQAVDKVMIFIAPMILGADGLPSVAGLGIDKLNKAFRLERTSFRKSGDDILIEGYYRGA